MIRERHLMPIVDDLGLSKVTDRAAVKAAEEGLITGADLMVHTPRARTILRDMQEVPGVSVGLHVDLFPDHDPAASAEVAQVFRDRHTVSPTATGREMLRRFTTNQIRRFQDMTGHNPSHISTHNHVHLDSTPWPGNVFPEFVDAVNEAVGGEGKTLIRAVDVEQVRHCRAGTLKAGQPPDSPQEFYKKLLGWRDVEKPLDLLVHPGLPLADGEEYLGGAYPLELRIQDLEGLRAIIGRKSHERAGYRLTSPDDYLEIRDAQWPDSMWPLGSAALLTLPPELRPSIEEIRDLKYPWKLLEEVQRRLHERVVDTRIAEGVSIDPTASVDGPVWFGPGVKIGPQCTIVGPTVLGAGTKVWNGSTVMHSVVGPRSVFGTRTEVSRSVVGHRGVTHNGVFLDSFAGDGVQLATSATGNHRVDCQDVVATDGAGQRHDTGMEKLGTIVGSFSRLGIHSSTDPGAMIGRETIVGGGTKVAKNIGDRVLVTTDAPQQVMKRR